MRRNVPWVLFLSQPDFPGRQTPSLFFQYIPFEFAVDASYQSPGVSKFPFLGWANRFDLHLKNLEIAFSIFTIKKQFGSFFQPVAWSPGTALKVLVVNDGTHLLQPPIDAKVYIRSVSSEGRRAFILTFSEPIFDN